MCYITYILCYSNIGYITSKAGYTLLYNVAFSFNETYLPELASPWGGHQSKSIKVDNLTKGQL